MASAQQSLDRGERAIGGFPWPLRMLPQASTQPRPLSPVEQTVVMRRQQQAAEKHADRLVRARSPKGRSQQTRGPNADGARSPRGPSNGRARSPARESRPNRAPSDDLADVTPRSYNSPRDTGPWPRFHAAASSAASAATGSQWSAVSAASGPTTLPSGPKVPALWSTSSPPPPKPSPVPPVCLQACRKPSSRSSSPRHVCSASRNSSPRSWCGREGSLPAYSRTSNDVAGDSSVPCSSQASSPRSYLENRIPLLGATPIAIGRKLPRVPRLANAPPPVHGVHGTPRRSLSQRSLHTTGSGQMSEEHAKHITTRSSSEDSRHRTGSSEVDVINDRLKLPLGQLPLAETDIKPASPRSQQVQDLLADARRCIQEVRSSLEQRSPRSPRSPRSQRSPR